VIASEDVCRCGVTAEISAVIAEKAFSDLAAPIMRVAVNNSPIPFAPECEKHALPDEKTIMDAIRRILGLDQGRL
jgi:pyruvate/2-oxoglutarate/acetoin dehydrogenase E1 component